MDKKPLEILKAVFGYDSFRGQQQEIIQQLLTGQDALVLMPTGGGKSLCYQIPSIILPGVGIVISPLIALMQDQVSALLQLGVKAAFLNSTLSSEATRKIEQQLLNNELDLLYIAPERLTASRTPPYSRGYRLPCLPLMRRIVSRNGVMILGAIIYSCRCCMNNILAFHELP